VAVPTHPVLRVGNFVSTEAMPLVGEVDECQIKREMQLSEAKARECSFVSNFDF
jgi:hypothetical protein